MDDTFDHQQSSCIFTASDTRDFCAQDNVPRDQQTQNCRFDPPGNSLPVSRTVADNSTPFRASTSSLPKRAKEYSSSGRPLALSMDGSVSPSSTATLFDDFLEVESSLQALAADEGSQLSHDFCTSMNGDTLRCSQEYFSAKGKPESGLKQLTNMTTGKRVHLSSY